MGSQAMELSIVIPVYNEESVIPELYKRLCGLTGRLKSECGILENDIEYILVNDGSSDKSLHLLISLAGKNSMFKIIDFARNFGHQIAASAGVDIARGNAVALLDADLQDPPEFIVDLYKKYKEGFDVVYAIRTGRKGENAVKRFTAAFFYRLLRRMTNVSIPVDTGDFRIMSRRTVDVLKNMPERHRFLRGMVSWIGFKQTGIRYQRNERYAGSTKYPFVKMIQFALDAITSFSAAPLRLVVWLGFFSAAAGIAYSLYVLYIKIFTERYVAGWSSLMIAILVMSGAQMITLGVLGEYIGRMSEELKRRPLYIIDKIYEADPQ
jgi:glycosyltransferase involved in cell wall biosynthesis